MTDRRVRSVCLVTPAFPPVVGGAESYAADMVRWLCAAGLRVYVVAGEPPAGELNDLIEAGGGRTVVPSADPPPGQLRSIHEMFHRAEVVYDLADREGVDVVHALSHDSAVAAAIALAGRPAGAPLLAATFSEIATEYGGYGVARSRFCYSLDRIDLHMPLSERYRIVAEAHGVPASKIHTCRAGIDCGFFSGGSRRAGRAKLAVPEDRFLITCPSRFVRRKGQEELLDAIGMLNLPAAEFTVALVGSINSGSKEFLDQIVAGIGRRGIAQTVVVATGVARDDMPDVLAASDLVVQPSHYEGLGFSALEAMAAGVCTILTEVAGFDEFARHDVNSFVVPPESAEELAGGIAKLTSSPETRARLAARARRLVLSEFDSRVSVARQIELYEKRLRGHLERRNHEP